MDYFEEAKRITREAVKRMSVHWNECEQHGVFSADRHDFCPKCEWFACEWCNAEFESKEMLEKHAEWCDRLYLAKW